MALPSSPDDFLNLDAEQQADALLESLGAAEENQRGRNLISSQIGAWFQNSTSLGLPRAPAAPNTKQSEAEEQLQEAYSSLEARVFIRPDSRQPNFCEITRAGKGHLEAAALPDGGRVNFARRALLAFDLHEALRRREVEVHFLQGKFETAILDGSVYLEAAIRAVGKLPARDVGVRLASKAFAPEGPLADPARLAGEQTGIQNLFTGYFGSVRNIVGHQAFRYQSNKMALQHLLLLDQLMEEVANASRRVNAPLP